MLDRADIVAIIPVSELEAGVRFYEGVLGLRLEVSRSDLPSNREAELSAGSGRLLLYESVGAGQSRHTCAAFRVDDIERVVAGLRERGAPVEEYDLPGVATEGGIALLGNVRAAWLKDPDGNIVAVEEVLTS